MIVNSRIIVFVIVKRTRASSHVSCAIEAIKLLLLLLYFDVAMATHPVPDCYYAGMVTPVFDLEQTLSTS